MPKVFVSEGSRKLAHELDDLRERWTLRKTREARICGLTFIPESLPDYRNPKDSAQALAWHRRLIEETAALEVKLTDVSVRSDFGGPLKKREYFAYRAALVAERNYKRVAQLYLKSLLGSINLAERQARWADLIGERPELVLVEEVSLLLTRLGSQDRVKYTEAEQQIVWRVRDFLNTMSSPALADKGVRRNDLSN